MHLVVQLNQSLILTDAQASARADAVGLSAPALSGYFFGQATRQGLVLGYTGFDEREIDSGLKKLASVLGN